MSLKHQTVLLGFGSMGGALAKGWVQNKVLKPSRITAVSLDPAKRQEAARGLKVKLTADPVPFLPKAELILLAVKPQQLKALLGKIGGLFPRRALVLSVAAGVTTQQIEAWLPQGCPVVRAMPNTPSTLGAGMTGVAAGSRATPSDLRLALGLMGAVGRAVEVKESLMDLVTALSGSGPAYFFKMIEALTAAGEKGGLDGPTATLLAAQTAYGAARMVLETGKSPEALRVQVTSPGGTTEAGLQVLAERGFSDAVEAGVQAAVRRGAELRRMNE